MGGLKKVKGTLTLGFDLTPYKKLQASSLRQLINYDINQIIKNLTNQIKKNVLINSTREKKKINPKCTNHKKEK